MEIVDHHDDQTVGRWDLVAADVPRHSSRRHRVGHDGAVERHFVEAGNRLRLPPVAKDEVGRLQAADVLALGVDDDDVDLDEIGARADGRELRLRLNNHDRERKSGRADAAPARRRAVALSRQAQTAYDQKQYAASADAYRRLIELYPYDFVLHFNRACALAHDGKSDEALASLALAVRYGFEDVDLLEKSKALDPLRADARFAQLERDARACCDERFLVCAPPNLDPRRPGGRRVRRALRRDPGHVARDPAGL
jgi:tetratricopeptide (TPR) repeat protein